MPALVALAAVRARQLLQQAHNLGLGQTKEARPHQASRGHGAPLMQGQPSSGGGARLAGVVGHRDTAALRLP